MPPATLDRPETKAPDTVADRTCLGIPILSETFRETYYDAIKADPGRVGKLEAIADMMQELLWSESEGLESGHPAMRPFENAIDATSELKDALTRARAALLDLQGPDANAQS